MSKEIGSDSGKDQLVNDSVFAGVLIRNYKRNNPHLLSMNSEYTVANGKELSIEIYDESCNDSKLESV